MTNENRNEVLLEGLVLETPVLSHENHGARFYRFPIEVPRLSGQVDTLPVLTPESLLSRVDAGQTARIQGQLRSFNNRSGVGSRLVVSVFARELSREEGEDENRLELSGTLCKPPVLRTTPLGRTICDMILAINRRYGRADYLPCIAWGSLAYRCGSMAVGDRLSLEGRLQSRIYTKEIDGRLQERTAFEVSVMSLTQEDGIDSKFPFGVS